MGLARKGRTALRTIQQEGLPAAWSLVRKNLNHAFRAAPGGLVRLGIQTFRPSDTPTRELLLSGQYESPERRACRRYIRADLPVVEFGACLGVVACSVNRRLKDPRNHVVVEANPHLLPILAENRDRNRCSFEMIHGAAGVPDSTVRLHLGGDALNSSTLTGTAECVDVPAVSLQQIVHQRRFARCALVCDIEGAELFLISNELPTLKAHVEVLIVEFHPAISGPSAVEDAHRLLGEHRFQQLWDEQNTFVFRNLALT